MEQQSVSNNFSQPQQVTIQPPQVSPAQNQVAQSLPPASRKTSGVGKIFLGFLLGVVSLGLIGAVLVYLNLVSLNPKPTKQVAQVPVANNQEPDSIIAPTATPETIDTQMASDSGKIAQLGFIRGPLSYPSEGIPVEMKVCAEPLGGGNEICSDKHIGIDGNVGFELEVPPGTYYVYAMLPSNSKQKAYYNEFVTCGLKYECQSRTKIEVVVKAGETVENILPHDWYAPAE